MLILFFSIEPFTDEKENVLSTEKREETAQVSSEEKKDADLKMKSEEVPSSSAQMEDSKVEVESPETGKKKKKRIRIVRRASDIAAENLHNEEAMHVFRNALFAMTPRIFVTQIVSAVTVAVFIIMVLQGVHWMSPSIQDVLSWGGNYAPYVLYKGEWWRLFTSMFLHFGLIHLAFNMWVFWDVGQLVERLIGPVGLLVLYVLSGLLGGLASVAWNVNVVSAGASGAVFGVFGALMGFVFTQKESIPKVLLASLKKSGFTFLAVNILFGMSIKGIDMAAHMGGLVTGMICGAILSRPISMVPTARQIPWLKTAAVAVVGTLIFVGGLKLQGSSGRDVFDAKQRFSKSVKMVVLAERRLAEVNKMKRTKKAGFQRYIRAIERDVVPSWKKARKTLKGYNAQKLPIRSRTLHTLFVPYVQAYIESLELWIKGARNNQVKLLLRAKEKQKEAKKWMDKISRWTVKNMKTSSK